MLYRYTRLKLHRNYAMASVTYLVQVFHFGSWQDFDLIEDLKKKCAKFCKKKISFECNQFNNSEQLLSDLKNMSENSPNIFLVSRVLLDNVWCTQFKNDILKFMLKSKTFIVFMNDVSERVIRMYSTQLLQKNVTKRSASAIFSSTPEDFELYFTVHLLAEVNEKPQVPYCMQNEKLIPVMKKLQEDTVQRNEISLNRERGSVRRMRHFLKKLKRKY